MGPVIRNVIRDCIRPVMGDEVLTRFSGILDEVSGAVFAIAPYTQLSKTQTQSIEVRETGGDTEETFGPESQAAIDAFVVPANIKALFNERMYFDGVDDEVNIGDISAFENDDFEFNTKFIPNNNGTFRYFYGNQFQVSSTDRAGWTVRLSSTNTIQVLVVISNTLEIVETTETFATIQEYELSVSKTGTSVSISVDGVELKTGTLSSATIDYTSELGIETSIGIANDADGFLFSGSLYDVVLKNGSGTIIAQWNGYGNTNADWEDQIGTNNGTVNGSPALFTGQGFDGRIATAYNQGSEAAEAVQATAANQPFIATAGMLEDGMRFDGSSTVLTVANFTPTVNATLAAWVKPAAATNVGYVMAVGNPATAGQNRLNLNWVGSSDIIRYVSEAENIDSDAVFGGTDWTFVTITVSGKNISFFRNAVAAGTGTVTADPVLTDETLRVGSRDGAVYFNGLIDAPGIWNRVLTPSELTKVYNATDPR